MSWLSVTEDAEIFYSDHGGGPPVLMLHGWACDGSDWIWLESDLAVDHRVIIIDQRGHGQSSSTTGPYGPKVLAEDAAKVLRHLAIESAVVIGHSMGGLVAATLAVEHPELVAALVLIDPGYGYTDETVIPLIAALRQNPIDGAAALFSRMYVARSPTWQRLWHERRLSATPADVVDAFCACYEGADGVGHRSLSESYFARRHCPTLSVHSPSSAALIAEWEATLPHGPHDQIVVWEDCGHFLHQERPEEFAALTRDWLAGLAGAADLKQRLG